MKKQITEISIAAFIIAALTTSIIGFVGLPAISIFYLSNSHFLSPLLTNVILIMAASLIITAVIGIVLGIVDISNKKTNHQLSLISIIGSSASVFATLAIVITGFLTNALTI